jgi:hypothetical protein
MNAWHERIEGAVDELVLLDGRLAAERGRRHLDLEVIARTRRVLDVYARSGERALDREPNLLGTRHPPSSGSYTLPLAHASGSAEGETSSLTDQWQSRFGATLLVHVQLTVAFAWLVVISNMLPEAVAVQVTPADTFTPGSRMQSPVK